MQSLHRFSWLVLLGLLLAQGVQARELPEFTRLVEQYSPTVVNISTTQKSKAGIKLPHGLEIPELPEGTPWDDLLRRFFGEGGEGMQPEQESRSLGSGFIIDRDGYILTNNHVVEGAEEIVVRLSDRREVVAELVGADQRSDIALLKIDAADLPVVQVGNSKELKVGEWVMAIGSPFGFDHSVSVGVVSALGRNLPSENYVPFIQTDVAINPGNSGGPLFNLDGEVVGINSQIYSRTGGFMGLSFAIPIDVAMDVVSQIKEQGYVSRGWLGVLIQDVTRDLAESFGMKRPHGALVAQVLDGSPAARGGIEVGDIITEFNGEEVINSSDLPPLVGRTRIGSDARVKVLRNGKMRSLKVKIAELPAEETLQEARSERQHTQTDRLGLQVGELSSAQRKELDLASGGVLVQQVEEGPASRAGIRRGDVIIKLNSKQVKDPRQFKELVDGLPGGRSVPVLVLRRGGPLFLALRVPGD
ncbi:MAG: DegQ family serine endoprotease [Gammaproteobacteria bacterium]|nr:DegQ family serine endoprotease [Gammaproteobacteria bacterium]